MHPALLHRAVLRACFILALFALIVGESSEAAGMYDDASKSASLGESGYGDVQLGEPNKKADTEEKEPGDGSDPPKGGSEEEKKEDDGNNTQEDVEDNEPDLDTLHAGIDTMKGPGPLVPAPKGAYDKIPNMEYAGTPENVKNREECEKKCEEQEDCRSYSWNEGKRQCNWSTGSLRYGHFWNFYSKEFDMNAFGQMEPTKEYFVLKGLFAIDEDQNMKTIEDKSVEDCKEICNSDPHCSSFSYHEGDNACLMGTSKVEYVKGWDYFERNQKPAEPGGQYTPYPPRLDSYHAALQEREKKSLSILAQSDEKIREANIRKEKKVKKITKLEEEKNRRLDEEAKQKEFAAEQQRKKDVMAAKQRKVDLEAAQQRGKFDETFHKQTEINKELMHKQSIETAVKDSMIARIHEKGQEENAKLDKRLAIIKDRSMKELSQKTRETQSKETLSKTEARGHAVDMKKAAIGLVQEERKYKSFEGYKRVEKTTTKAIDNLEEQKWLAEDKMSNFQEQEKEVKRQIGVEKQTHEVHRKLIKEKEEKGPLPQSITATAEKTTLPPPPPPFKSPPVPEQTPGGR